MKSRFVVMLIFVGYTVLSAAQAVAEERPVDLVRQEVAAVLALLDDKSLDSETRRQTISDRIARHFDFEDMSRSILAVNWKNATDLQRERFKALFFQTIRPQAGSRSVAKLFCPSDSGPGTLAPEVSKRGPSRRCRQARSSSPELSQVRFV